MRKGLSSSRADELVNEIRGSIQDFEPSTDSERAAYNPLLLSSLSSTCLIRFRTRLSSEPAGV
jgi:hypothetical protein